MVDGKTDDPDQGRDRDEDDNAIVEQGPSIGEYRREPIPEYIVDSNGVRFDFDRIAIEGYGGLEPSQLEQNECLLSPGLIYRRSKNNQTSK
jgi:hypothetical protein